MRNTTLLTAAALVTFSLAQVACVADSEDAVTSESSMSADDGTSASSELQNATASDDDGTAKAEAVATGTNGGDEEEAAPKADPNANAGAKPTAACTVSKDKNGFFVRSSSKSSYVAYVPKSYNGSAPVSLVVGLHGCGDSAANFASWGINPADSRATQQHIGISIGGKDGQCWSMGGDDDKVLAAVDDISKCFWVHQKKVTIAGFSSGGQLAYRVGMMNASRFAGILIENSNIDSAGNPDTLLANAAWKIRVAHLAHTNDSVFPLTKVKTSWSKIKTAGFPLVSTEVSGTHDGNSQDWADFLLPQAKSWTAP